jgi:hypothetical protein
MKQEAGSEKQEVTSKEFSASRFGAIYLKHEA